MQSASDAMGHAATRGAPPENKVCVHVTDNILGGARFHLVFFRCPPAAAFQAYALGRAERRRVPQGLMPKNNSNAMLPSDASNSRLHLAPAPGAAG